MPSGWKTFTRARRSTTTGSRDRLLPGRETLFRSIPLPDGGVWVDLGGGTGATSGASPIAWGGWAKSTWSIFPRRCWKSPRPGRVLRLAERRGRLQRRDNVPPGGSEGQRGHFLLRSDDDPRLVRRGGQCRGDAPAGQDHRRGRFLRLAEVSGRRPVASRLADPATFWPAWFSIDNVFLSPDHVPLLQHRFETVVLSEACRSRIPYLPFGRVPYYVFLGRKPIRHGGLLKTSTARHTRNLLPID